MLVLVQEDLDQQTISMMHKTHSQGWGTKKKIMKKKKLTGNTSKHRSERGYKEERSDKIEFAGTVTEVLPSTLFRVEVSEGVEIIATLAGKLRQNKIRILLGDRVKVEVSPYDMTRGRITYRTS